MAVVRGSLTGKPNRKEQELDDAQKKLDALRSKVVEKRIEVLTARLELEAERTRQFRQELEAGFDDEVGPLKSEVKKLEEEVNLYYEALAQIAQGERLYLTRVDMMRIASDALSVR